MLDHGHPNALSYPVCKVFAEANYVVKRINAQMASETLLLQMALSAVPNQSVTAAHTNRAAKQLKEHLKGMLDGEQ
ncbi:hypothetical protein [Mesorhizobium sp. B2-1-2]|uniref:hypothetical protein n=1 Tax=Mesorhizobium sp. B2-1-2 TaxID=2589973 RepID=UPI0011280B13|nr:hypothetical protein [Mesorhizobium sp. B2-1-2]TPN04542.1 hypothetical protein FJ971_29820 [Mesorhizobium sp. B2-1-2]